jgi:hypothetical protein
MDTPSFDQLDNLGRAGFLGGIPRRLEVLAASCFLGLVADLLAFLNVDGTFHKFPFRV